MNSADKLRNIVREALRNFISETGIIPKGMEFNCLEKRVTPGNEPPRVVAEVMGIEIVFQK